MKDSSVPLQQKILRVLAEQSWRAPAAPALEAADIIHALQPPAKPGDVYTNLSRLARRKQIARRAKGYLIMPAGLSTLDTTPRLRPWDHGTVVSSRRASYQILKKLRPLGRVATLWVEVFEAVVLRVETGPRDELLRPHVHVVIKTLPNQRIDDLRAVESSASARYIRELKQAFDIETQKLSATPSFTCAARTLDWGAERITLQGGKAHEIPFVVQEYVPGPDLVGHFAARHPDGFRGLASVDEWFALAEVLTEGLKEIHAAGAFRRHIWPGTIFVLNDRPVFVDLVEAAFRAPLESPEQPHESKQGAVRPVASSGAGEVASWAGIDASAFIAPEARGTERSLPDRRADSFSLGAVLYYAATGQSPNFTNTEGDSFKKEVFKKLQGTAASENYGVADIVSRCLRVSTADRMPDVWTMLCDIRTFRSHASARDETRAIDLIRRLSVMAKSRQTDVFGSLASVELEQYERVVTELEAGSVNISGGHNDFVVKLCSYLSTLTTGDEYWTVTVPDFWLPENLGTRGRYLSMNAEIVRRGAKVLRVFLLTDADLRKPSTLAIVEAHCDIERDLRSRGAKVSGKLDVRYKRVTDQQRHQAIEEGHQIGMWIKGESQVRVKALYNSSGQISSVNIRRLREQKATIRARWFDKYYETARPLSDWGND